MVDNRCMVDPDKPPPAHPSSPKPPGYPPPGYPPPDYPPPQIPPPQIPPQMPSSNIGWAIAALFTFWPLAIPAFIFSSRVESYWFQGNWFGAQEASHDARLYGLIAVIVGAVIFVVGLLVLVFIFVVFADTVHEIHRQIPTVIPVPVPS